MTLSKTEEILHSAVCQAVAVLNISPELASIAEGRQVRDILRKALEDYANAFMDELVQEEEFQRMQMLHRAAQALPVGCWRCVCGQVLKGGKSHMNCPRGEGESA